MILFGSYWVSLISGNYQIYRNVYILLFRVYRGMWGYVEVDRVEYIKWVVKFSIR